MELVYLWVEDYKNIHEQGFNFSPRFHCVYDEENNELTINKNEDYIENFFQNLVNTFKDSTEIFKDTNDIKRLLIGHHVEDENIDKRPLNKLIKDISKELGLL